MTATISNAQFINDACTYTKQFWTAYEALKSMQDQWNALDYGSTLMDGSNSNGTVTAASVGAVLFDSMNAITTVMATGVATNLAKLL